jgi:hypothetical protein
VVHTLKPERTIYNKNTVRDGTLRGMVDANCRIEFWIEVRRFYQRGAHEQAVQHLDLALKKNPNHSIALNNRGNALKELRRYEETLASYDRALTLRPDYAEAHYNEAFCRLLVGDFNRGWQKQEWRWETQQGSNAKRNFTQPLWTGREDIPDKTILLHAEQGFGDAIQFCRYAPFVLERAGGRVILEVQRPLHELFSTLSGSVQIVSKGDPLPDFDIHCPLLSLPLAFGTRLETIPSATPYLHVASEAVAHWNAPLGPKSRPRIGLAWSSHPAHKNDHNRSIGLSALLPLLDFNATFVSLQQDVRPGDASVLQNRRELLHCGDELKTFADTAALISNLDLIISVDTSMVHLAGALAKPVWVLLPFIPDWRWLLDREDRARGTRQPGYFGRTKHANGIMSLRVFTPLCRTSWHGRFSVRPLIAVVVPLQKELAEHAHALLCRRHATARPKSRSRATSNVFVGVASLVCLVSGSDRDGRQIALRLAA